MKRFFLFGMIIISCFAEPAILVKIPTRSRPEQFFKNLDKFYEKLSGKISYHFIISCDEDDYSMNNSAVRSKIGSYPNLTCSFHKNQSKIEAYNCDIGNYDFDIVIVASDDMEPIVKGYDEIIVEQMNQIFPDGDGVLHFNDGYVSSQCNTMPIVGRRFYDRFGYVYNPLYKSLVCDVELTLVSRMLGKEALSEKVLVLHNHPGNNRAVPIDALYVKNNTWHKYDLDIFYARRKHCFDIDLDSFCIKKWSILLYTKGKNNKQLRLLQKKLEKQIDDSQLGDNVELLVDSTDSDDIGFKRNFLLGKSKGVYVTFLDDSIVSINDSYVKMTYAAIKGEPDSVALLTKEKNGKKVLYTIQKDSDKKVNEKIEYRLPSHFSTIKKSIAGVFTIFDNDEANVSWINALNKSGYIKKEAKTNIISLYF